MQIYEVESADDLGGVCLARCVGGTARVGQAFVPDSTAEGLPPELRVTLTRIERYGRGVGLFDPPHTARLTLTGRGVSALSRGSVISFMP
ncbi:hypothetical protein ACFWFI_38120 [Streptomyces sp. NPDC060209]|uniref:hypothetical protein n=1 Tax=Streptomyces sp. NPDC060209 TaxID=3347073 RepID=UPI003651BCDF